MTTLLTNIDAVRAEISRLEDALIFDQRAWAIVLMALRDRPATRADAVRRMETAKQLQATPAPSEFYGNDELLDQAKECSLKKGYVSLSYIQRALQIGYCRAGRIVEQLQRDGFCSKEIDRVHYSILSVAVETGVDHGRA